MSDGKIPGFNTGRPMKSVSEQEMVDHPSHYGGKDNPYEAIKVIEAWGLGFNLGTVLKYIARHEKKGAPLEDLKKAAWYLAHEIEIRTPSNHIGYRPTIPLATTPPSTHTKSAHDCRVNWEMARVLARPASIYPAGVEEDPLGPWKAEMTKRRQQHDANGNGIVEDVARKMHEMWLKTAPRPLHYVSGAHGGFGYPCVTTDVDAGGTTNKERVTCSHCRLYIARIEGTR